MTTSTMTTSTMTTSTVTSTGRAAASIERDLRRMELLNRREQRLRAGDGAASMTSYLTFAARPRERGPHRDA